MHFMPPSEETDQTYSTALGTCSSQKLVKGALTLGFKGE